MSLGPYWDIDADYDELDEPEQEEQETDRWAHDGGNWFCPRCDVQGVEVTDDVLRCPECKQYFEPHDDDEGGWDLSSRHRTGLREADD